MSASYQALDHVKNRTGPNAGPNARELLADHSKFYVETSLVISNVDTVL